jgi:hypothetical protein
MISRLIRLVSHPRKTSHAHAVVAALLLLLTSRPTQASTSAPALTWVHVPGALFPSDCVHPIPDGATVDEPTGDVTLNGLFVAHYDPCPVPPIWTRPVPPGTPSSAQAEPSTGGWVEGAQANFSSDNLAWLYSEWTVPENPSDDGALLFLFQCSRAGKPRCHKNNSTRTAMGNERSWRRKFLGNIELACQLYKWVPEYSNGGNGGQPYQRDR